MAVQGKKSSSDEPTVSGTKMTVLQRMEWRDKNAAVNKKHEQFQALEGMELKNGIDRRVKHTEEAEKR